MVDSPKALRNLAEILEAKGLVGAVVCVVAASEIERLEELAADLKRQRDDNYQFLCEKDRAMGVLFERLTAARVDVSDLIP